MRVNDRSYFLQRAETEMACAERAALPAAVKAHTDLAAAYLQRAAALERARERR